MKPFPGNGRLKKSASAKPNVNCRAIDTVVKACRKHGKFPGMGGMYTPELLERHVNMGVQLILSGSDFSLLMQAATARAGLVRGFESKKL